VTFRREILFHREFCSIISLNHLDSAIKLVFNLINKIHYEIYGFVFIIHEKNPSEACMIIHNVEKKYLTMHGNIRPRPPNIDMK